MDFSHELCFDELNKMLKPEKIYARDIIAIFTLLACFILMAFGIDSFVSFIIIMVITFYFSRRFDGEGEPSKDINNKVKKLEEEIKTIPQTLPVSSAPQRPPLQPGQVIVKPPILS